MLALAGAVHDTSHHGDPELRDAGARVAPHRHLVPQVVLDLLRHLLEERAGRPPATGTAGDLRQETPETERLQDLLRDAHFLGAIAARRGCQRDPDGVADAFLQQQRERGARCHDSLHTESGFGQSEMKRIVGARGELAIDIEQILHSAKPWRESTIRS